MLSLILIRNVTIGADTLINDMYYLLPFSYGAKTISLSKLVPQICKMLEDQSIPVREQVVNTLVEIYRHVGERVRHDILKREINQAKWVGGE